MAMVTLSALVVATGSTAAAWPAADEAIRSLEQADILDGTNCSIEDCDGDLLRWEAAIWFARALELKPDVTVSIADAPADTNIAGAVAAVAREGVTVGCDTQPFRFCGDSHTTRAQMASFLTRAFDLRGGRRGAFTDVDPGSVHARNIGAIERADISNGCATEPLRFCPDDPISRQQGAVMLHRALEHKAEADASQQNSNTRNPRSSGGNPGFTAPPARPACVVVDHVNTHHDIDDHRGDPDGDTSYALLPDGTLFGHRHDHGDAKCWRWAPVDEDGNQSNPQDAQPPTHTH